MGGPSNGSDPGGSGTSTGTSGGPIITVTGGSYLRQYTHTGTSDQSQFSLEVTIQGSFTRVADGLIETASIQYSTWRSEAGQKVSQSLNQTATVTHTVTLSPDGYDFFGLDDEDGPTGYDWEAFAYHQTEWAHLSWVDNIQFHSQGTWETTDGAQYPFVSHAVLADQSTKDTTWTPLGPGSQAGTRQELENRGATWFSDVLISDQSANFPAWPLAPAQDPRSGSSFVPDATLAPSTHFFARSWDHGGGTRTSTTSTVLDATKAAQSSQATVSTNFSAQNGYRYYDQGSQPYQWTETINEPAGSGSTGGTGTSNPDGSSSSGGGQTATTITGQGVVFWLIDALSSGTESGSQTSQWTGVHTGSPVGTTNETFEATSNLTRGRVELTDQYQIGDGTTQVNGTLSIKVGPQSSSWFQTKGTGSYTFDATHPGSLEKAAKPASGTVAFTYSGGASTPLQFSDQFTFESLIKDEDDKTIGLASGTSLWSSTDQVNSKRQGSGTWNLATDTGTLNENGEYTGSGASSAGLAFNVTLTDESLHYQAGWSVVDQSTYQGTSAIVGSFDAEGQPILATVDFHDEATVTTTAYSAWENGTLSLEGDDGFTSIKHAFSTQITNLTPLVDQSSETYHLVFDAAASGGGTSPGAPPTPPSPGTGDPDGSGSTGTGAQNGPEPTIATVQFSYQSTGTLRVQSSFDLDFASPIHEPSGSSTTGGDGQGDGEITNPTPPGPGGGSTGGSGATPGAKIGLTTGSISADSTDTIQLQSLTVGTWDLVANQGSLSDESTYSGDGTSTVSVDLHAAWDEGSIVYNTGYSSTDQSVYAGKSKLAGTFDAQGNPILATFDGQDSLTLTTPTHSAYENGVFHDTQDGGDSKLTESFATTLVNTAPLVETSTQTYHLVFEPAAGSGGSGATPTPGGGDGSSTTPPENPPLEPTSGTIHFQTTNSGTLKLDVSYNMAVTAVMFAGTASSSGGSSSGETGSTTPGSQPSTPPNGSGSTGTPAPGTRVGLLTGSLTATSSDTVQSTSQTSGTYVIASKTLTLDATSQYSGTGSSTANSSLHAEHDDGSLTYNAGSSVVRTRVYSGDSDLTGSFDEAGAPILANLDIHGQIVATTTTYSAFENGKLQTVEDGGNTSVTQTFSVAIANTSPLVAQAEETYHFEFDASAPPASLPGTGGNPGGGSPSPSPQPGNPDGSGDPDGQNPPGSADPGLLPTVATLSFRYETTGATKTEQSAAGTFHSKLSSEPGTGTATATGSFTLGATTDYQSSQKLSGTWDLLAGDGHLTGSATYDATETVQGAHAYHFADPGPGILYNTSSGSKTESTYAGQSKLDGFIDAQGKQTSGTRWAQFFGSTDIVDLSASERYESRDNPVWQKAQTGEGYEAYQATIDLTFAADGTASGTSIGSADSTLHLHDVSSWVGVQRVFDSNHTGGACGTPDAKGYLPGQIGTLTVNDHGDDDLTMVGNSSWNLTYAADQPSGKSSSAVQVSGTTQWTTDHNLVLHQDGHVVYQTTGQDKTALTGSDAIWFEYQAGKIGGERTMTVANTESHNLTIDGTGSGVGSGGWSGDWKYHYQSEDLVDDTDTKKFAWTDGKWSQTDHTFRTDHKGSSSWWFDMGRTYNQVYDPELGSWRTEIENQKMGGSSSYHEVKWGGANNYQFSDKRGGSSFKNGSGSGSYGFNLSGSGGSSAYSSAETASYRDNRAGTVVNGVTTYSSVDIHSLAEKTSWSESQNQTLQVTTWTRNDDWSRDEITIRGDSNSLTTTKNNAFTKVFAYANGTGSGAPGTGGYSLGDNQSSTGTTTGAANGPILGGNYNNTLPGTPGSLPQTSGYFGGSIIVNGRQTPGGFWGGSGEDGEDLSEFGGTQFISDIIVPIKGNNPEVWDGLNGATPDKPINEKIVYIAEMYRDSQSRYMEAMGRSQEEIKKNLERINRWELENKFKPPDNNTPKPMGYFDKFLDFTEYGISGLYSNARTFVDIGLGFIPVVSDGKDWQEALTGHNYVTGEDLTLTERGITAVAALLPFVSGPLLRYGAKLIFLGKKADDAAEAVKETTGLIQDSSRLVGDVDEAGKRGLRLVDEVIEDVWCFSPNTLVLTENGKKPICEIEIGTNIFSFNFNLNKYILTSVLKRHDNYYTGKWVTFFVNGQKIELTANHPIWVADGKGLADRPVPDHLDMRTDEGKGLSGRWINSQELMIGDLVLSKTLGNLIIEEVSISEVFEKSVCNLTVSECHNFLVGTHELLAHNEGWCDALNTLAKRDPTRAKPQKLIDECLEKGIDLKLLHAHHIVMKGNTYASSKEARELLSKYGIDSLDGTSKAALATGRKLPEDRINELAKAGDNLDNMAWAIRAEGFYGEKGLHSKEAQDAVLDLLKKAEAKGGSYEEIQENLKEALNSMREQLQSGKGFW